MFWIAGIVIPLVWVIGAWWQTPIVVGACAVALAGIVSERWLFFAEARHVVTLYYGQEQA